MHRNTFKTSALVLVGAVALAASSMGGAVAAGMIGSENIRNNSIQQEDLQSNSVGNSELRADAVGWGNVNGETQDRIRGLAGTDGAIGPAGPTGAQGPKGEPGDPASDVFGEYAGGYNGAAAIGKIGGTFASNATELGQVIVPDNGQYMVTAYGFFDRLNEGTAGYEAPPTDTYLQLTVRGSTGHAGTCFTPAVSAKGFTETTCQSVQVITANAGDVLTVRAFGYNEDRSGFGGTPNSATPQFTAAAAVSLVRIGDLDG